jgi:hypothetical protein
MHFLSRHLHCTITIRAVENILCKARRYFSAADLQHQRNRFGSNHESTGKRKTKNEFPLLVSPYPVPLEAIVPHRFDKIYKDGTFGHLTDLSVEYDSHNMYRWRISFRFDGQSEFLHGQWGDSLITAWYGSSVAAAVDETAVGTLLSVTAILEAIPQLDIRVSQRKEVLLGLHPVPADGLRVLPRPSSLFASTPKEIQHKHRNALSGIKTHPLVGLK